jgi:hypothetical protein
MLDLKRRSGSNLIAARFCLPRVRRPRAAAPAKGALNPHEDLRANCASHNLCTDFRLLPICLSSN